MRWLMIGLFISLAWLLFAVTGLVWHVWRQRRKLRREALDTIEGGHDADLETEP